ncbi:MAG: ferredoxin reductase family protein [Actinomycetota bacterium]
MTSKMGRGVALIALLCIVPVVLWATSSPLEPRFSTASTSLTALGVAFGLAGIVAFALNIILGTRLRTVERVFGGLDKMYAVHRVLGRVAFLLLLTHALLVISGAASVSMDNALQLLDPSRGWTVILGLIALVAMTVSVGLTLYAKLNHELFVYVQRTFGAIFIVGALHAFRTPGTKSVSPALTVYLLVLSAAAFIAYVRRSLAGDVLVKRYDYRVTGVTPLDQAVIEIVMSPKNGRVRFTPGQFVFLTFSSKEMARWFRPFAHVSEGSSELITLRPGDVKNQFHPFSITSARDAPDLRVAVKAVGDYTSAMRALEGGAWARAEGPYGGFGHLRVKNPRQIWVAGGIGVTPFLSMARSFGDGDHRVDFYFAVKSRQQAYFVDELRDISDRTERLSLIVVPEDEEGFLTAAEVDRRSGGLDDKDILICGPVAMIRAMADQFRAQGVPNRRVHYELFRFGAS